MAAVAVGWNGCRRQQVSMRARYPAIDWPRNSPANPARARCMALAVSPGMAIDEEASERHAALRYRPGEDRLHRVSRRGAGPPETPLVAGADPDQGGAEGAECDVQLVTAWLLFMLWASVVYPRFFRRRPETSPPGFLEAPPDAGPAVATVTPD